MLKNIWKRVHFYCGCHKPPKPLTAIGHGELSTITDFICPLHEPQSEANPEGYTDALDMCPVDLSFREAEEVVDQLSRRIENDFTGVLDLTGYRISTKHGIKAVVQKYSFSQIDVAIEEVREWDGR